MSAAEVLPGSPTITREPGWMYYVDAEGDVSRVQMRRRGTPPVDDPEKLHRLGLTREKGFLYFIDRNGQIARVRAKVGGSTGRRSPRRKKR